MSTYTDKYSTEFLSEEQMHRAAFALPAVLQTLFGSTMVTATYGGDANLHMDLCYLPMSVHTNWMMQFLEQSVEQRIVVPGRNDFWFVVPEERLHVMFCHERDIHLNGSDDELLRQFMATEPFSRFKWFTREEMRSVETPEST